MCAVEGSAGPGKAVRMWKLVWEIAPMYGEATCLIFKSQMVDYKGQRKYAPYTTEKM